MKTSPVSSPDPALLSKRHLAWASLAALVGCAACCAIPLLAAGGLGGAAGAALSRVISPGSEVLVGAAAFAVVLGGSAWRRRSQLRRGRAGAAAKGACGCDRFSAADVQVYRTPAASGDEPIACTADLSLAQVQIDAYRAAFTHLVASERFAGGFRWIFRAEPGLVGQLRDVAAREHECCRFLSFDVKSDGRQIVWETRASERAASVLEEYSRLPQRLSTEPRRGRDVALLKRAADEAGLKFTADQGRGPALPG